MRQLQLYSLWIEGALSRVERLCLASGAAVGYDVTLFTYGDVIGIPRSVIRTDAREILPEEALFTYGRSAGPGAGSPAAFANWFRYELLRQRPGVWIDTDYVVLRRFPEFGSYLYAWERPGVITNALLGRNDDPAGLFASLCDLCKAPYRPRSWDSPKTLVKKAVGFIRSRGSMGNIPWGTTGPSALTALVKRMGLIDQAFSSAEFFPIGLDDWRAFFAPSSRDVESSIESAYGVHLWNEMIRRHRIDKTERFPDGSWLDAQERRLARFL